MWRHDPAKINQRCRQPALLCRRAGFLETAHIGPQDRRNDRSSLSTLVVASLRDATQDKPR
jgi:hypothetical protein